MLRLYHSCLFDYPNDIWWELQITNLFIMQFSPLPCHLVPPDSNILLSILFSNTLSLRSSLNVSDRVSHPHKTTGKIIVPHILIFIFLASNLDDKGFYTEWEQEFPDFNLLLISYWIEFWFCPALWSRDMTTYLVSSAFTSSPLSLLANTTASVFFFTVCTLLHHQHKWKVMCTI